MEARQRRAELRVFGIRHHGPGSARSLLRALEAFAPDTVLIEGPPDANELLPLALDPEMRPPVALLIHRADRPQRASFFPFAVFSPEWQAIRYALARGIATRFIDLPQAIELAIEPLEDAAIDAPNAPDALNKPEEAEATGEARRAIALDPLGELAAAAGYSDGERWWEHLVEERRDDTDLFAAVLEAMAALREGATLDAHDARREAHMRQAIRAAEREGAARIAVVCGAWHAPALISSSSTAREDADLLKGLPRTNVSATWAPWTNGRLTAASGYRAGIRSPGWYEHLWSASASGLASTAVAIGWMSRVARLLRDADLDASPAQVIEAVRLAESLAALRGCPLPGLVEMTEATRTIFCFGSDAPLALIGEKLVVGETLGAVPERNPILPLESDLAREQRRLRLQPNAAERELDLDLRRQLDLERSHLLHRLSLLGINWGSVQRATGKSGTFHEIWKLQWRPELAVAVVEASKWGNTIHDAATAAARDAALRASDLPQLVALLDKALLAELPRAVEHLIARVETASAVAPDTAHLMEALPPLLNLSRYGNVRRTEKGIVARVIAGMAARISVGLPGACSSLSDEAAAAMSMRLVDVDQALTLGENEEQISTWRATLRQLADQQNLHGLLGGKCCRLLLAAGAFTSEEAARRLSLTLSRASDPAQSASWIEGFLEGSGTLLVHDDALWRIVDEWLSRIPDETFTVSLPLLRRTFATFSAPERRQLGERARAGAGVNRAAADEEGFDEASAARVLPLVARMLGATGERWRGGQTTMTSEDGERG